MFLMVLLVITEGLRVYFRKSFIFCVLSNPSSSIMIRVPAFGVNYINLGKHQTKISNELRLIMYVGESKWMRLNFFGAGMPEPKTATDTQLGLNPDSATEMFYNASADREAQASTS